MKLMMTSNRISGDVIELWVRYSQALRDFREARRILVVNTSPDERIALVRAVLNRDIETFGKQLSDYDAYQFIKEMDVEERKQILDILVNHASSSHGYTRLVQELILTLPRQWLIENFEPLLQEVLDPLLEEGADYEELLDEEVLTLNMNLSLMIDAQLTKKYAQRLAQSSHPIIREEGEMFLRLVERETT